MILLEVGSADDGERLKRDRKARGMTLRKLGDARRVNASSIGRLETGDRHDPLAGTLMRLSDARRTQLIAMP